MTEYHRDDALRTLKGLRQRLVFSQDAIHRKRSLRPSEKAMALAKYGLEIDAIDLAILLISESKDEQKPSA